MAQKGVIDEAAPVLVRLLGQIAGRFGVVVSQKLAAQAVPLIGAQFVGGFIGAVVANMMFDLDAISISTHDRTGANLWLGEVVATLGLVLVIFGSVRSGRTETIAYAVGGYITAAYWFTSSTSFANPAVTVARMFSDTFAGIAPSSVPVFVLMQLLGGVLAVGAVKLLYPRADLATLDPEAAAGGAGRHP